MVPGWVRPNSTQRIQAPLSSALVFFLSFEGYLGSARLLGLDYGLEV
jgi:hypothetical protein